MPPRIIRDADDARALQAALEESGRAAVDCEAAGFHRYSDRLCLLQVTVGGADFVVDALAFDPSEAIGPALADPAVRILMHGADYDIRLLDRDLGLRVRGLFDTQVAASLLGEPVLGLSPLLERHLGVTLSKKYQRADWARRPLPDDMIAYAASDTQHLPRLAAILDDLLEQAGRSAWAKEEFELLEEIRWEPDEAEDPVTRVRRARKMPSRDVDALREALEWRDSIARSRDRAPFRIAGDEALLTVAVERPRTMSGLRRIKGMSRSAMKESGQDLIERMRSIERIPEKELQGYPKPRSTGPGRPPPEVEERAARLKAVRNRRAEELGLGRGTLMPNATLLEVASREPGSTRELESIPGVKGWQLEAIGDDLLEALASE